MSKFNKGDLVRRTGANFQEVRKGFAYVVEKYQDTANLYLRDLRGSYDPALFELVRRVVNSPGTTEANLPKAEGEYNPNVGHTKDGGGLQQHSVGGPYPFVLVGIDNPTGLKPGLYWFVQDKTGRRVTAHRRSCDHTGNVAASLSQLYPDGICPDPTPDLSLSDGYTPPLSTLVTIEVTREAAEVLQLLCAHTAGSLSAHILPVITEALGYEYHKTKERYDVSFWAYGPEYTSGWHEGRNARGALAVTPKGAA